MFGKKIPDWGTLTTPVDEIVPLMVVSCLAWKPLAASELSSALVHCGSAGKSTSTSWASAGLVGSPSLFLPSAHSVVGEGSRSNACAPSRTLPPTIFMFRLPGLPTGCAPANGLTTAAVPQERHHEQDRPDSAAQPLGASPITRRRELRIHECPPRVARWIVRSVVHRPSSLLLWCCVIWSSVTITIS